MLPLPLLAAKARLHFAAKTLRSTHPPLNSQVNLLQILQINHSKDQCRVNSTFVLTGMPDFCLEHLNMCLGCSFLLFKGGDHLVNKALDLQDDVTYTSRLLSYIDIQRAKWGILLVLCQVLHLLMLFYFFISFLCLDQEHRLCLTRGTGILTEVKIGYLCFSQGLH